jgi:hypothetical protein
MEGLTGRLPNYSACAPEIGSRCQFFEWCHGSDEAKQRYFERKKGEHV